MERWKPKSLEKFNESLPLSRAVGDRIGNAGTLLGGARVEQKRGNLTQARQAIEQAISVIESLRTNTASQELRASQFAYRYEFFETYIDVLMQMHKQNPVAAFDTAALAVSERARARSLLELLEEARADIRQDVDDSLLEREHSLRQLLNAKAAAQFDLLNRKHTPEQAAAAAKEIAAITDEYEEIQARIRARSPRYASLHPQPLGLTEIQQQALDEDTLLLEFALGEKRSYLWLVSHRSKEPVVPWRRRFPLRSPRPVFGSVFGPVCGMALVMALLLTFGLVWSYIERVRLTGQIANVQKEAQTERAFLKQREQELASRNQEFEKDIADVSRRNEQLKAELEQLRRRRQASAPTVLSFLLAPAPARSEKAPPQSTILLSAGKARLLMELDEHDYANYQAVLQTFGGREILRRRTGKVRFGKDRAFATLLVKVGKLAKGDYTLILFGQTLNDRSKEIYRYFFRVS